MAELSEDEDYIVMCEDAKIGHTFIFEAKRIGKLYYVTFSDYEYIGIGKTPSDAAQDMILNGIRPRHGVDG